MIEIPPHMVEQWNIFQTLPDVRYHILLYDLILKVQPYIVVETGVAEGIGSYWILRALEALDKTYPSATKRFLYSVEFNPRHRFQNDKWICFSGLSYIKLREIFQQTGAWDLFIHDSDHEVGCTTYEYELAWRFVRPGGYVASDDYVWGCPQHCSWQKFCSLHCVRPFLIGSLEVIQKPNSLPMPIQDDDWIQRQHAECALLANQACKEYGVSSYIDL